MSAAKSFVWMRNHQMPKMGGNRPEIFFGFLKEKRYEKAPDLGSHPELYFGYTGHHLQTVTTGHAHRFWPSRDLIKQEVLMNISN